MIPLILGMVLDMLDSNEKQLLNFKAIKDRPYILSDNEINRCLKLYPEMSEDAQTFLEQCEKWRSFQLTKSQTRQVQEIETASKDLIKINDEILILVNDYNKTPAQPNSFG